jgi:CRISPR-associated protein (TIGR02584 family)
VTERPDIKKPINSKTFPYKNINPDTKNIGMDVTTYPKRILLAVTGLSPQVVTETLYALHQQNSALPTEVHLLSTAEGADRARLTLLTDHWFEKLCNDYSLPHIAFTAQQIHILKDAQNRPMEDIRSLDDNQAAADAISEWIRQLTSDDQTSLHVSIAGGRKTMGFYAGYALSLFGRMQDSLTHVLVSSPFESHPNFYYPTPYSQIIYAADHSRKPLDTAQASVTLADIPFVRLRHGLPDLILQGKSSFSEAVNKAQQKLGPPSLKINLQLQQIQLAGRILHLPPAELAFYSWFSRRKLNFETALKCPSDGAPEPAYGKDYLAEYQKINSPIAAMERTEAALANGMDKNFFEQRKSRLHQRLKTALGMNAEPYLLKAIGQRPYTRYESGLEPAQIQFL